MKKSKVVVLGAVMVAAIAACKNEAEDDWTAGFEDGRLRDTFLQGHSYRHYGGYWYPIYRGMISPYSYNGATVDQIARPGYRPTRSTGLGRRAGGFGARGRSSVG